jgi:hypothetical protein
MIHNAVKMRRHNDIGVNSQTLLTMTKIETFQDDLARCFADKNRQPIDYGEGDVKESAVIMKSVAFHGRSLTEVDFDG